jgi:cysteate synthase
MSMLLPTRYKLHIFDDERWTLKHSSSTKSALIRAKYHSRKNNLKESSFGFYIYADWIPIRRILLNSAPPGTYKSEKLSSFLN